MNNGAAVNGFKVLGITDERNECDCCGRTGLKCTVAIQFDNEADTVFYGRTCAARVANVAVKVIDKAIRDAAALEREARRIAAQELAAAEFAAMTAWLDERVGPGDRFDQLSRFPGGRAAAFAAYRAG